jgi:hypothetical protein
MVGCASLSVLTVHTYNSCLSAQENKTDARNSLGSHFCVYDIKNGAHRVFLCILVFQFLLH